MIMRDTILEIEQDFISDNAGGFVPTGAIKKTAIECKVSISNDVAFATQYGVATDDLLTIVSRNPLNEEVVYEYNNKRFKCRGCRPGGRLFYSTLVGVK